MSNTLFIGKVYHRFDELPSTNDWAAQIIAVSPSNPPEPGGASVATKTKPPEGTVVRAANQTAGRGQLGSRWHSPPDENLLLSVILYPIWLEASAQFYLSMAVALALRDTVVGFHPGLPVSVKWPNDCYVFGKKTGGILIQNTLSAAHLQTSIVGIGLNVNQLQFPPDLPNATSLALALGQKISVDAVAERLFECLERRYLQLKAGHRAVLKNEYEAHLWRRDEWAGFVRSKDGHPFDGRILGVSERGSLRVETQEGVEEFDVKELVFTP